MCDEKGCEKSQHFRTNYICSHHQKPTAFENGNVSRVLLEERQLGCGHLGTDAVVQSQRCAAMDCYCHLVSSLTVWGGREPMKQMKDSIIEYFTDTHICASVNISLSIVFFF